MPGTKPITVLLIDDDATLRKEISRILDLEVDLKAVGEAADGESPGYVLIEKWTADELNRREAIWQLGHLAGSLHVLSSGNRMRVIFTTRDGQEHTLSRHALESAMIDADGIFRFS
jgi:chemotaxis response regulator CheB